MVLLGLGEEKEDFQILDSKDTNTGIEYYYPKKELEHLRIKDRLLVKKYVALLNKIQMIENEDKYFFIEEQATAIELLIDISSIPIFSNYKTETIEKIKNEINSLSAKLDNYNKNGLSEFERKKSIILKNKNNKSFYKFEETDDIHYEFVKTLTNLYTRNSKKED
ncbi:MAG: hypothetical protein J6O56_02350 [Bacilli bacterium]|nr:hypothetical protein [Bacilli bacterium]